MENVTSANFGGPAGAKRREGAQPPTVIDHGLYTRRIAKRSVTATFCSTTAGQIVLNMLGGFSKNYFTKSMISSGSVVRI